MSGTFAKSTPYLAWGNAPPRLERRAKLALLDGDSLNGRLRRDRDFDGHRLLFRLFLFPAQGRGENQRLDVDDFDGFADVAHIFS